MEKWDDPEWVEAQKIVISCDLIMATKLHLKFLEAVDNNGKLYNGCVLERAIFRYKYCWLPLLAKHCRSKVNKWQLIVPLDCEWIWHCHRLNPIRYMADCEELFGTILDPSGVAISSVEGTCKKETQELWNATYPEEPYELNVDGCYTEKPLPSTNYDLVSAVKRQTSFYPQVSRAFMKDDIFLEGAFERYKGFLHMIRRNMETKSKNFCVPTYDIDLMWHTHQLRPLSYCNDLVSLIGNVLDHDDTDSDRTKGQKLDVGFTKTTKQWEETFSSRYWRAGAMYRDMTLIQAPNRHNFPSQESDVMFVEILMEIIGKRNRSSNHNSNLFLCISKKQYDMLFKGKRHFSISTNNEETQAVLFHCEPKGELLMELIDDSLESFGTCSISLSDLNSKLATVKWLEFKSDLPLPITLGIAMSKTQPSLIQQTFTSGEDGHSSCGTKCITARAWATSELSIIGSAGCGGVTCGGGGGCGGGVGCRASCGGCRASCGGGCRGGGGCSSK